MPKVEFGRNANSRGHLARCRLGCRCLLTGYNSLRHVQMVKVVRSGIGVSFALVAGNGSVLRDSLCVEVRPADHVWLASRPAHLAVSRTRYRRMQVFGQETPRPARTAAKLKRTTTADRLRGSNGGTTPFCRSLSDTSLEKAPDYTSKTPRLQENLPVDHASCRHFPRQLA